MRDVPSTLCDAIHSIAVHNGVVRVVFARLDADGKPFPTHELQLPVGQISVLLKALAPIARPQ